MRRLKGRIKTGEFLKKGAALLLMLHFTATSALGTPFLAPALLRAFRPADHDFIVRNGSTLGLRVSETGASLLFTREGAAGRTSTAPMEIKAAQRALTFLSKLSKDDPELGMALALRAYLAPRMAPKDLENNRFLKRDENGRLVLTALGRTALVDVITATDGELLEPLPAAGTGEAKVIAVGYNPSNRSGSLNSAGRAVLGRAGAILDSPEAAFDGTHRLERFDWGSLDAAPPAAGGLKGFSPPKQLAGYKVDEEAGTVRVIVAARKSVKEDHFAEVGSDAAGRRLIDEAGLDQKLLFEHGAKVVRAVDNLVTIDVPLPQAAALGIRLQKEGIESRPARVFRAATKALTGSPAAALLGGQFLPLPSAEARKRFSPRLADSRVGLDTGELYENGMRGKGTTVGIIDSGIDEDHPDFKDEDGKSRVIAYMDFTKEDGKDVVGHGTHVAGTVGGSGAASKGKYRGVADRTRFKVAKVFGSEGETDESVLLAAMKWMAEGEEKGEKADIVNMSLGGPGTPNVDPLSAMANHLTVKENILVVAAAGNEGPWESSIGSPGNSRYALTVGGVNKEGKVPFFSSRGPIRGPDGELYAKPDVLGVSGDVDLSGLEDMLLEVENKTGNDSGETIMASPGLGGAPAPNSSKCVYSPGVIGPRSKDDPDNLCTVKGAEDYRYMSGTSMATPMVSGMAADVIGYLKAQGVEVDALQIKALIMETARDLGLKKEDQGAGLANGKRLAKAVMERVQRGLPVGNIAFSLAMRLTTKDKENLGNQTRYELTELGLLDTGTGHLVNNEADFQAAVHRIRESRPEVIRVDRRLPSPEILPDPVITAAIRYRAGAS